MPRCARDVAMSNPVDRFRGTDTNQPPPKTGIKRNAVRRYLRFSPLPLREGLLVDVSADTRLLAYDNKK